MDISNPHTALILAHLRELVRQHATAPWPDLQIVFCGNSEKSGFERAAFYIELEQGERGYGSKFTMAFSWVLDELIVKQTELGLDKPYAGLVKITGDELSLDPLSIEAATQLMEEMHAEEVAAELKKVYANILSKLPEDTVSLEADKYSGVFLPCPFAEYWKSHPKVMIIGRETAGWNANYSNDTLNRIVGKNRLGETAFIVNEAVARHKKHLPFDNKGNVITTSRSRFKQFYFKVAKELNIGPKGMIYSNLFAWDYAKGSPLKRPKAELDTIKTLSLELLAAQIRLLNPDFIVFATGVTGIDGIIKDLFARHFDGHESVTVIPRKYWEFKAAGARCFRIAHPRAMSGHQEFRQKVIDQINALG